MDNVGLFHEVVFADPLSTTAPEVGLRLRTKPAVAGRSKKHGCKWYLIEYIFGVYFCKLNITGGLGIFGEIITYVIF